jgi:hypothetical protein
VDFLRSTSVIRGVNGSRDPFQVAFSNDPCSHRDGNPSKSVDSLIENHGIRIMSGSPAMATAPVSTISNAPKMMTALFIRLICPRYDKFRHSLRNIGGSFLGHYRSERACYKRNDGIVRPLPIYCTAPRASQSADFIDKH